MTTFSFQWRLEGDEGWDRVVRTILAANMETIMKQIYHFDETVVVGCTKSCNFVKRISPFLCNFHEKILSNSVITRPVFPKGSHAISQNWTVSSKSYLRHTFSSCPKALCYHCHCLHSAKHTHNRYIWYTYTYNDTHLGKSSQLIYAADT